jgi:hypothetical protein
MDRNSLKKLMELSKLSSFDKRTIKQNINSRAGTHSKEKEGGNINITGTINLQSDLNKIKKISKKNNSALMGNICVNKFTNLSLINAHTPGNGNGNNILTTTNAVMTPSNNNNNLFFGPPPENSLKISDKFSCVKYSSLKYPAPKVK